MLGAYVICRVKGYAASIAEVVVDALHFEEHGPYVPGPVGHHYVGKLFHCLAVGGRVSHAVVPGDALGQEHAFIVSHALGDLFDTLVHVAHADLQVEDRLSGYAEAEVAGLDDARVYRAYRYFEDPFAFYPVVRIFGSHLFRPPPGVLSQGVVILRPGIVQHQRPKVRVPDRGQPEHIRDLPLEPVGRVDHGRQ